MVQVPPHWCNAPGQNGIHLRDASLFAEWLNSRGFSVPTTNDCESKSYRLGIGCSKSRAQLPCFDDMNERPCPYLMVWDWTYLLSASSGSCTVGLKSRSQRCVLVDRRRTGAKLGLVTTIFYKTFGERALVRRLHQNLIVCIRITGIVYNLLIIISKLYVIYALLF